MNSKRLKRPDSREKRIQTYLLCHCNDCIEIVFSLNLYKKKIIDIIDTEAIQAIIPNYLYQINIRLQEILYNKTSLFPLDEIPNE